MSVGLQPTKEQIDQTVGLIARQLNVTLSQIAVFKFWLDQYDANALQAAPWSYSPGDAALLKSVAADLDQLRKIYEGSGTLADVKDFRTFAKQVFGFGIIH